MCLLSKLTAIIYSWWIWESPDWPNYILRRFRFLESGRGLLSFCRTPFWSYRGHANQYQSDAAIDLMLSEAITTSAIEGETPDRDSVRSSLLNLVGVDAASPNSDEKAFGAAMLVVDVRKKWDQPLTHELLGGWQTMACPEDRTSLALRGMYRGDAMQIVSGPYGRWRVHYEAPAAKDVQGEMSRFLDWYNNTNQAKKMRRRFLARSVWRLPIYGLNPFILLRTAMVG
ncbi:DUF4172 domain-containing protein [Candidatus Vondammii sp. HM_W22]|uniref:DUF4172 domain-containing protein n=1 Tax=Candidatus Vondammii sp. HM_W22 TaxID=2687299 RepID=UPI002E7B02E7|nr:DUF4172 domain-containing protein [Candidatus Vondammii sp. HM_W22]